MERKNPSLLIKKNLDKMSYDSGVVLEGRVLNTSKRTVSGYFNEPGLLAKALTRFNGKHSVYFTLNPVNPDLLARAENRLEDFAKQTTSDADIIRRIWLPIDLDPKRASGISSTDQEHEAALAMARTIRADLKDSGWPEPFLCDSGNGAHLLYPIDLPNDDASRELIRTVLVALDLRYSNDYVEVDKSTFNAARIWKLYGTVACKGDDTIERPHRMATILDAPSDKQTVELEMLKGLAMTVPDASVAPVSGRYQGKPSDFDLVSWMKSHSLNAAKQIRWQNNADLYVLESCPWNESHTNGSAYIIQFDNGGIAARCHHNSCSNENWSTLRDKLEPGWNKQEKSDTESCVKCLIRLGSEAKLFRNELNEPYAAIPVNGHWEVVDMGKPFTMWLRRRYFEEKQTAPGPDSLNSAVSTLQSFALFDGDQYSLHHRVAGQNGDFYYDLADSNWRAVKVTPKGCEILDDSPILFMRTKNMMQQLTPNFNGEISKVLRHCRFKSEDDQILYLVYLVSCLIPYIPHPVMVLCGEKGSAKSTTARMTRAIVDPASKELLSMPKSDRDLAVNLYNNYMPCFDNMDALNSENSDTLCMASTGGGISYRKLYSDGEESILHFKHCVMLNGINVVATKPDLLDRSIVLELERIREDERKTERKIWSDFEADRAEIIGGALTALSKAMALIPSIELNCLGRMADFTHWGFAIAEVLGIGGTRFLEAYDNNYSKSNQEAVDSHPVASAVLAMMKGRDEWTGSVADLLEELEHVAETNSISMSHRSWPKGANILSKRLREVKSNLTELGIEYDIRHAGNYRRIIIANEAKRQVAATQMEVMDTENTTREEDCVGPMGSTPPKEKAARKKIIKKKAVSN